MIRIFRYEKDIFEAVATGRKTFVDLEGDTEILVGDFLAINEVETYMDTFTDTETQDEYQAQVTEATGRCCLVEVVYIEMVRDNKTGLASIRPCGIGTSEARSLAYSREIYKAPVYNRKGEVSYL